MQLVILYIALVATITTLFLSFKQRKKKILPEKETILSKTFFVDHGTVNWKVTYTKYADLSENSKIDMIPYCKNCKIKFRHRSNKLKAIVHLKCSSCASIKNNYPLSANYHTVLRIAEEELIKLRKACELLDTV